MAVFLVNQCTFSKLPNINNDQQNTTAINNGSSQNNQNFNDSTSNLGANNVGVGMSPSNICGLKFDSLFELIHHIEDNHITDVDYPGIAGPFYNGHSQLSGGPGAVIAGPGGGLVNAPPVRDSNIYNVIPHDRHHMTQIINGGWLPTSCILRIFNSTHKQQQPQQQIQHQQPPTHQLMHKLQQAPQHHLQAMQQPQQIKYETGVVMNSSQDSQQQATNVIVPIGATHPMQAQMQPQQGMLPQQMIAVQQQPQQQQPMTVDMVHQNTQICATTMDSGNPHHIMLASPKIVGNLNGTSYHVASGTITATQSNVANVTSVASPANQGINNAQQQQVNVNNSIQQQQLQLQQQTQPPSQQQQQLSTPTTTPKPTKVYKCNDCTKTYKTMHGLRTHQSTHHPNSPHTDGKAMAIMPEGGDTPSGSPAELPQQQQPQQQQQPMMVDMVHQNQQMCATTTMDSGNAHHIMLASPKIVGNLNGTSYHVASGAMTATQSNVANVTSVASPANQAINNAQQQQVNVNNSIQQQQLQLQQQQQQQQLPQQQQHQNQQQVPTPTPIPKPTKVYKCNDCTKTYKTMHGLRTHQSTHHPNSPHTDGKAVAIMPEGGDTPSGSPADLPQQQNKIPQQ